MNWWLHSYGCLNIWFGLTLQYHTMYDWMFYGAQIAYTSISGLVGTQLRAHHVVASVHGYVVYHIFFLMHGCCDILNISP